jgi:WD40 repeat protein
MTETGFMRKLMRVMVTFLFCLISGVPQLNAAEDNEYKVPLHCKVWKYHSPQCSHVSIHRKNDSHDEYRMNPASVVVTGKDESYNWILHDKSLGQKNLQEIMAVQKDYDKVSVFDNEGKRSMEIPRVMMRGGYGGVIGLEKLCDDRTERNCQLVLFTREHDVSWQDHFLSAWVIHSKFGSRHSSDEISPFTFTEKSVLLSLENNSMIDIRDVGHNELVVGIHPYRLGEIEVVRISKRPDPKSSKILRWQRPDSVSPLVVRDVLSLTAPDDYLKSTLSSDGKNLIILSGNRSEKLTIENWNIDNKQIVSTSTLELETSPRRDNFKLQFNQYQDNAVLTLVVTKKDEDANIPSTLYFIDMNNGGKIMHQIPVDKINSLDLTLDGKYLVTGHAGGKVRLWHVKSGHNFKTLTGHKDDVLTVKFGNQFDEEWLSLNGRFDITRHVISEDADEVILWNLRDIMND